MATNNPFAGSSIMQLTRIVLLAALALFATQAHAVFIVDTGAGDPNASGGLSLSHSSTGFQWLAARFTSTQSFTVTDIEGWISESRGTISLAIYEGDSTTNVFSPTPTPDTSNEIFRQSFNAVFNVGLPRVAWQGLSGLTLNLDAGIYWVAFEVLNEGDFGGYMPADAPNPLDHYAFINQGTVDLGWGWTPRSGSSMPLGLRVQARSPDSVPEPGSLLLMGLGLAGLGVRHKSQQQIGR